MGLWPVIGPLAPVMITTQSFSGLGIEKSALTGGGVASLTSVANRAVLVPIYIPSEIVVRKLCYATSTAPSGNVDIGLYNDAFNRIVSKGSTAIGGASLTVEMDVTDTPVDRGTYYLALAFNTAAANMFMGFSVGNFEIGKVVGLLMQDTTGFPLPATLTPVVITTSQYPQMGISQRDLIA